jgi:hypothetical protein
MKIPLLVGAAVGYVLGARAGRERYEQIVRLARKVGGSQTVQSMAGVLQAQLDGLTSKARTAVADKLPGNLGEHLPGHNLTAVRVNGSSAHHN